MASDIRQAPQRVEHEDVRRAYLVVVELWSRAAMRADSIVLPVERTIQTLERVAASYWLP
jgi:hypothetical protein